MIFWDEWGFTFLNVAHMTFPLGRAALGPPLHHITPVMFRNSSSRIVGFSGPGGRGQPAWKGLLCQWKELGKMGAFISHLPTFLPGATPAAVNSAHRN